jgi:hypothetical protein
MRLWSIHPRYLDAKGLVALWREALLAKAVLSGRTRGYRAHPQLERFRAAADPLAAMRRYLEAVFEEARRRGYSFDARKLGPCREAARDPELLTVTRGQLAYERAHLLAKLAARDPERRAALVAVEEFEPHPLFREGEGDIEPWEAAARR